MASSGITEKLKAGKHVRVKSHVIYLSSCSIQIWSDTSHHFDLYYTMLFMNGYISLTYDFNVSN